MPTRGANVNGSKYVVRAVVLAAAGLLAVAGCATNSSGGQSSAPSEGAAEQPVPVPVDTVALSAWLDEVNAACRSATEQSAANPQPQSEADVAPALDTAAALAAELTASVESAGTPDAQILAAATYVDLSRQATQVLTGAAAAAREDPQAALAETAAIEVLGPKADAVAAELGLTDCYETEPTVEAELLDLGQVGAELAADAAEEEDVFLVFVDVGFDEAEARCIANHAEEAIAAFAPEGEPDVEAIEALLLKCGIDLDRLLQVLG